MDRVEAVLEMARLELVPSKVIVWHYIFEKLGPIMDTDEQRIEWVKRHRNLMPIFFEIYSFVEEKVMRLLECGLTKGEAVEKLIELINERQSELDLKPNLNKLKLRGQIIYRLRLYLTKVSSFPIIK